MITVIELSESKKWNNIVKSFKNWDIYYTNEYATSLMLHGDGEPKLVYWEQGMKRVCYILMIEDLANVHIFKDYLNEGEYYDATVPYGYGGPLMSEYMTEEECNCFYNELCKELKKNNIISQFVRFHPLFAEQRCFYDNFEAVSFKDTIFIDTSDEENIWENMESSNRNMIRKSIKMGVKIYHDKGENINHFIDIYNETMDGHRAEDYYYFDKKYYDFLINNMSNNIEIFYSYLGDIIIGASIFFYNDKYMHYHLSGVRKDYRKYASTNLLLYEAAKWANHCGIKKLHLGGGLNKEDSLFKFKKKFNKKGIVPFYVGRSICDNDKYETLLDIRQKIDATFDRNNSFLIQYRK